MAVYTYETIPASADEPVHTYELRQSMRDDAFTHHPETGEPIRRVILGGWGASKGKLKLTETGGDCCGSSGCC